MMAIAATQTTSLIAFTLPGTPYSVQMARFYVRAALGYHDLGHYAGDVETVTSELVSNAIALAASGLVSEHKVSIRVAWQALEMLAANRYVTRAGDFKPYHVTWDPTHGRTEAR